jgi:long-chain acyl-CoA synthetase
MLEDARDTEPTVMLAVPLLLEKMLLGVQKRVNESSAPVRALMLALQGAASLLNVIREGFGNRLLWRGLRKRMGFGRLRFFVSGGAALSPSVQKGLESLGFTVLQGYGLSETSPVVALNPPRRTRSGSAGLPIPDVSLQIMDPDSQGIGEIAVKGPNVMPGYYRNDPETRSAFTDDRFFLTGDMGYQDDAGFLFITGRKKTTIVTKGGKNIFPEEIESLMLESPYIEEILVITGRHPRTGDEEIQALIFPDREATERYLSQRTLRLPEERADAIRTLLREELDERSKKLAAYKRIVHFKIRDEEFPKTPTHKIKRYLFEKQTL